MGHRYTPEEDARIALLVAEGMPSTWIAEDLQRPLKSLQQRSTRMPGVEAKNAGWAEVWPTILHDPALLALHHEFAPNSTRYSW